MCSSEVEDRRLPFLFYTPYTNTIPSHTYAIQYEDAIITDGDKKRIKKLLLLGAAAAPSSSNNTNTKQKQKTVYTMHDEERGASVTPTRIHAIPIPASRTHKKHLIYRCSAKQ